MTGLAQSVIDLDAALKGYDNSDLQHLPVMWTAGVAMQ